MGDTAGEGNNRVVATALGVAGEVEFCASALGAASDKILMVNGDNQRGLVGNPLANPLEAMVVDADGNPIQGVAVTFTVTRGNGNLTGEQSLVRMTGIDGIARAVLTLGTEPGINNNVVNATFAGLTGLPATFVASGLPPGNPAETRLSGVVLDNGQTPIPGAVVSIEDTNLSATTDDQGLFLIENVPVGRIILNIDPSNSPRPETFPPLLFETVTVAGQTNTIGQPILLPALQTENSQIVGGPEDVILTMQGVAGLSLTVFANSATFHDGSQTGQLTISQAHLDKVPMPPPNGSTFMPPAWTIQPAGVLFDPPARVTIPNDGLPPGRVIDIFQFDHVLNQFINVGKGTASDDGSIIVSDSGFGITRSGWGGCGQPQPPTTCVGGCPACQKCVNNACVADNSLNKPCCDRAKEYEKFKNQIDRSDPRKLFASALVCVANDICRSVGPEGRNFDDPNWLLCINKELFVRWKAHNSACWISAEATCEASKILFPFDRLSQQLACFAAKAACHDFDDMIGSLGICGCGTDRDWDKVGDIIGDCSHDIFDKIVDFLSRGRSIVCP